MSCEHCGGELKRTKTELICLECGYTRELKRYDFGYNYKINKKSD